MIVPDRSVMIETVGFCSIGGREAWKVLRDSGNRETASVLRPAATSCCNTGREGTNHSSSLTGLIEIVLNAVVEGRGGLLGLGWVRF